MKLLAAYLVIALHAFPEVGLVGYEQTVSRLVCNGLARIAVPLFFMISGYFMADRLCDFKYMFRYGKRILILFLAWQLIYLYFTINQALADQSVIYLAKALIHGYWHLWYLSALIVGVVALYLLRNLSTAKLAATGGVLYVIGYVYQLAYSAEAIDGTAIEKLYQAMGTSRNGVFFGLPLLIAGVVVRRTGFSISGHRWAWAAAGIASLLAESYAYNMAFIRGMDLYLSILPLSLILFDLANQAKCSRFLADKNLAIAIYLIHPMIINLSNMVHLPSTLGDVVVRYVLVALVTTAIGFLAIKANRSLQEATGMSLL